MQESWDLSALPNSQGLWDLLRTKQAVEMENHLTTVLSQLAFTKAEDPSKTLQLLSSSCSGEPLC